MNVSATVEAFNPQKRTFSTSKNKFFTFFYSVGYFCPPGSGSGSESAF